MGVVREVSSTAGLVAGVLIVREASDLPWLQYSMDGMRVSGPTRPVLISEPRHCSLGSRSWFESRGFQPKRLPWLQALFLGRSLMGGPRTLRITFAFGDYVYQCERTYQW